MIEPGYCRCGCGAYVGFRDDNNARKGWVKGDPKWYVKGHQNKKERVAPLAKACSQCGVVKKPADFGVDNRVSTGLHAWCRDCMNERRRLYNQQHNYSSRYYHANREKVLDYARKRYAENKEYYRERWRDYSQAHKAEIRAAWINRRARKIGVPGEIRPGQLAAYFDACSNKCLACGASEPTVDHIIPMADGGPNFISNIQPLCLSCNSKKQRKTIDFRPEARFECAV